jgi:crotonobetainyl-CoA:carnitine CoA-transferase CaiB-like acyl-CoA transferase
VSLNSDFSSAPLTGIKVLDLSRVLAGPWCTMTLADLGADVIKVENPAGGDDTRSYRPPEVGGESAYFLSCNRSKRSIALDFSTVEGQEIVRELASHSDVLVENYRLGTLERYGLDYATLKEPNPRLIYCSISGYGRHSKHADRAGYDSVIQAEGGLMSVTGQPDGSPAKVGVSIADILSGMNGTQAILAALYSRERSGRGQFIDLSLLDGVIAVLANLGTGYFADGRIPGRWGTAHPNLVPCQAFGVADGQLVLVIGNDRQFRILVRIMGLGELADDDRFATNERRVTNRSALLSILCPVFLSRSREDWLNSLHAAGLPAGAIRNVQEVLESPEVIARGMVAHIEHPRAGKIRVIGSPLKMMGTPLRAPFAPPLLGQHTADVLSHELGYDEDRIRDLQKRAIVMQCESSTA